MPADKRRVRQLMTGFAFGGRAQDLSEVDARKNSGMYNHAAWMIALDGATLLGHDAEYRYHLTAALDHDLDEDAAEKHAYNMTALAVGVDEDSDWEAPEWAAPYNPDRGAA